MNKEYEVIKDYKCLLGEGPVWDYENKCLYWLDCFNKRIFRLNPDGNTREYEVPQIIGNFNLKKGGGAIAALQDGIYDMDLKTGELKQICSPDKDPENNRFNDGKCDAAGRLIAGTMSKGANISAEEATPTGSLYKINSDGSFETLRTGVSNSNGLCWSADNKYLYYVDSPTQSVVRYDYDLEKGTISNETTIVEFALSEGMPDGMTIDEEGMLWVAMWGGYGVLRVDPFKKVVIDKLELPVENVTCAVFGGENLDELYITSSTLDVVGKKWDDQPLAGALFRVRPGVRGLKANLFGQDK